MKMINFGLEIGVPTLSKIIVLGTSFYLTYYMPQFDLRFKSYCRLKLTAQLGRLARCFFCSNHPIYSFAISFTLTRLYRDSALPIENPLPPFLLAPKMIFFFLFLLFDGFLILLQRLILWISNIKIIYSESASDNFNWHKLSFYYFKKYIYIYIYSV